MTNVYFDSLQHENADPSWIKVADGAEAARQLSELSPAKIQIDQAVADFYTRFKDILGGQAVLGNLSPAEAHHLAAMLGRYLCAFCPRIFLLKRTTRWPLKPVFGRVRQVCP